MTTQLETCKLVRTRVKLTPELTTLPVKQLWIDYDREADVLYLSFRRPQSATKTVEMEDGDVLVRTDGEKIVGITINHPP